MFNRFKKPISFVENDIYSIHNNLYGVTVKRDGQLVALISEFFDGNRKPEYFTYVYNINEELVKKIPSKTPHYHKFVVYGELLEDGTIYIFDCNLLKNFRQRYDALKRVKIPNCIINKCTFTRRPFDVIKEDYTESCTESHTESHTESCMKSCESLEGYIFTPVHGNGPIYKYKWEHTVDFAVYNGKCYCMISKIQYEQVSKKYGKHDIAIQENNSNYFPMEFFPCSQLENGEMYNNTVIECKLVGGKWIFYRHRPDKTKQLPFQGPNNWKTCLDHYNQYTNNLTLKKIKILLNKWEIQNQ